MSPSERTFRMLPIRDEESGEHVSTTWFLTGPEGATSFTINRLPLRDDEQDDRLRELMEAVHTDAGWFYPSDLGRHHRLPKEGYSPMEECYGLANGPCWYTGSTLAAQQLCTYWREAGLDDQVIRYALEEVYAYEFADE